MPNESDVLTADVTVEVLILLAKSYCVTLYIHSKVQKDLTITLIA